MYHEFLQLFVLTGKITSIYWFKKKKKTFKQIAIYKYLLYSHQQLKFTAIWLNRIEYESINETFLAAVYSLHRLQITIRLELLPTWLYLGWYNDCLLQASSEAAHACTCRCEMRPVNILFVQGYLCFFF